MIISEILSEPKSQFIMALEFRRENNIYIRNVKKLLPFGEPDKAKIKNKEIKKAILIERKVKPAKNLQSGNNLRRIRHRTTPELPINIRRRR